MVVTFGAGMSRISSVSRGEDNGSDNEDNLGQQGRTPCVLSVPCGNGAIQTDMHARLPLLAQSGHPEDYNYGGIERSKASSEN